MSKSIRVLMVRLDGLTSSFDVEGDHMAAVRETKRSLDSLWASTHPVAKVFFAKASDSSGWRLEEVDVDAIRTYPPRLEDTLFGKMMGG